MNEYVDGVVKNVRLFIDGRSKRDFVYYKLNNELLNTDIRYPGYINLTDDLKNKFKNVTNEEHAKYDLKSKVDINKCRDSVTNIVTRMRDQEFEVINLRINAGIYLIGDVVINEANYLKYVKNNNVIVPILTMWPIDKRDCYTPIAFMMRRRDNFDFVFSGR